MRKLENTLVALAIALLVCMQMDAQIANCRADSQTGQSIEISLFANNETPIGGGDCTYDVQATIATVSGMLADATVIADVVFTAVGSTTVLYNNTITLPIGSASNTLPPVPATITLPCAFAFEADVSIQGGTNCVDRSFFPVELTNFEANSNSNGQVQLNWETASELENQGFEIERSREGKKWETLDFVKGVGTTFDVQQYDWIDMKPYTQGLNYYRLKQIDFDGTTDYSEIVVAELKPNKEDLLVVPNPANDFLNLQLGDVTKEVSVAIYNSGNQLMKSFPIFIENSDISLDISDLPNGIYWIMVSSRNTRQQTKFVKLGTW